MIEDVYISYHKLVYSTLRSMEINFRLEYVIESIYIQRFIVENIHEVLCYDNQRILHSVKGELQVNQDEFT